MTPVVAKVGGSLFDLPDLRDRLRRWVDDVAPVRILFVPGGGDAADVIRRLDRLHRFGESTAHWLALRMTAVNAHFLAGLLGAAVVGAPGERDSAPISVVDPHAFCRQDDGRPGALEHSWHVTSDSIAARVAAVASAPLVLMKSVDLPADAAWDSAAATGLVDGAFPGVVGRHGVVVSWVNLRRPEFALPR